MAITVSAQDVTDAENFLVEYLSDNISDGDYTDGSALRDLTVKAVSFIVAYLKKTDEQIRARQSLKSISEIDVSDDAEAADDAADAIISNWFASRNLGNYARVVAYGHVTERSEITIFANNVFYRTANLGFLLDNDGEDIHIPAEDLVAQFDSEGNVLDYIFKFNLVAENPGVDYETEPGNFVSFDDFNPYVTRVEILEKPAGATDIETTSELITRSQNLVTVRNLINARSCDAVLRDTYASIRDLSVVGMGDTEMIRDRVQELATELELHVGGHQDIFIDTATMETSFSGEVGGVFTRPDGVINVFRDATYADYDKVTDTGHKFTEADLITAKTPAVGMVLRVYSGLGDVAHDYNIRDIRDTELHVSERVPFPLATDEKDPVTYVTWSIGQIAPNYNDVVPQQTATGETSKQISCSGRITLPGKPVYAIKDVTIADDADPDADPEDGLVHFYARKNETPADAVAPDNEYQVIVHNPQDHQSIRSFTEVVVGTTTTSDKYDGKVLKVTYDTLVDFTTISEYVVNKRQRIAVANPLVRAYHPIYIRFIAEYELKRSATTVVDETEAAALLVEFINAFAPTEILDVSTLIDVLRGGYPQIGQVYPFIIEYDVHVPDGRVIPFETADKVTVPHDTTSLRNVLVYPDSETDGLLDPVNYGLSDDVMRYVALETDIIVTQKTV